MFIGIDLSLTGTGLAFVSETGQCTYSLFASKPQPYSDRWMRYDHMSSLLIEAIAKHSPNMIMLEDYILRHQNAITTLQLIEYGAIVRLQLTKHGWPWITAVGSQLKKWITGRGSGSKSVIIKDVYKQLKIDVDNDNLADAIVLAHMARDIYNVMQHEQQPDTKYRQEVIKAVMSKRTMINQEQLT